MNQELPPTPGAMPTSEEPKKNNTVLIIAIVLLLLCCCCIAAAVALYFGYDQLGDPLHIYGSSSLHGALVGWIG